MRQIGSELTTTTAEGALTTVDSSNCSATNVASNIVSTICHPEDNNNNNNNKISRHFINFSFLTFLTNWGIKQFCWALSFLNFSFDWLYPLYDDNRCIPSTEADDPLKRIQDEINEVARRERELREKTQRQQQLKLQQQQQQQQQNNSDSNNIETTTTIATQNNHHHQLNNHSTTNGILSNNSSNNNSLISTHSSNNDEISTANQTSISPVITNGKDSNLDTEHHSDDSGISASSSPIPRVVNKYIRTNNYNVISPTPQPQFHYNKTFVKPFNSNYSKTNGITSNIQNGNITQRPPILKFSTQRRITTGPAHKGLMQRFIATRGKVGLNNNASNGFGSMNGFGINGGIGIGVGVGGGVGGIKDNSPIDQFPTSPRTSVFSPKISNITMTPPIFERDAEGKPLRPGYIPVEEKIQKELKDIKSRESELKRIRRLKSRQSQPDLLESIDNEFAESDEDSDVEHCYPPGKLRAVKSIGELCDSMNSSSLSPTRTTPSPNFERSRFHHDGIRPAVSLAQLCEIDNIDEAPSSHELIAKWESLIQQNA